MDGAAPTAVDSAREEIASERVCDIERVSAAGADPDAADRLLIEVPHGATRASDYAAVRDKLSSPLPDRLEHFFFVNTDAGAPECARAIARRVAEAHPPGHVRIVRGLVPRTFVDCNRRVESLPAGLDDADVTPLVPPYVTEPEDVSLLMGLYLSYQDVARAAYRRVCGAGGGALILHTYAPRTVDVQVDADIVEALHAAYEPATYAGFPPRPELDLISRATDGRRLAPPNLVDAVRRECARVGIQTRENETYRLHPATMGYRHSAKYPGQVLCIEVNRALLADPFTPFEEMRISESKTERIAAPIAAALLTVRGSAVPE